MSVPGRCCGATMDRRLEQFQSADRNKLKFNCQLNDGAGANNARTRVETRRIESQEKGPLARTFGRHRFRGGFRRPAGRNRRSWRSRPERSSRLRRRRSWRHWPRRGCARHWRAASRARNQPVPRTASLSDRTPASFSTWRACAGRWRANAEQAAGETGVAADQRGRELLGACGRLGGGCMDRLGALLGAGGRRLTKSRAAAGTSIVLLTLSSGLDLLNGGRSRLGWSWSSYSPFSALSHGSPRSS